jgi:23S rRNA (pseudouridine1915-N3)-methyltransferase
MKIKLICIGKTANNYLKDGINEYIKRLQHYCNFETIEIPDVKKKNLTEEQLKIEEGKLILNKVSKNEYLILLDERGKLYNSKEFSENINKKGINGISAITFVIGGAYGFSEEVYKNANEKLALSKMTFTHQMVRLVFLEQLYRAFTIIKGEKYHH